ncbi:hypothetical protein [Phenylobacterium sp.]|uniref:hypothetical protein n=1 Tax=Phenylobacterium sp. TaxID=1871053 RepID=UPI002FC907A8
MSAPFALLTQAGKPAIQFERLRDLAHHVLHICEDPRTQEQCDLRLIPCAISVQPTSEDEAETRPAVSIHRLRDQVTDIVGYARVGEPGRDMQAQREDLMAAVQTLLRERAQAAADDKRRTAA